MLSPTVCCVLGISPHWLIEQCWGHFQALSCHCLNLNCRSSQQDICGSGHLLHFQKNTKHRISMPHECSQGGDSMWPSCFGGMEVRMQRNLLGLQGLCHCPGVNVAWRPGATALDLSRPGLNLTAENL